MATTNIGTLKAILLLEDQFTDELKRAEGGWTKFGKVALGVGVAVTAAAGAVGFAAAKIAKESFMMAVEVEESENLVRESFGDMTGAAEQWSKSLAESVGLNEFTLRKQAASLFLMVENMGFGRDAAFDMATGLTKLTGDLGSFFNMSPEEAFDKIQSGMIGNIESLRSLNVFVNMAELQQIALRDGLIQSKDQWNQNIKAQVIYNEIIRQTTKAHGDLERTIDSPANAMRVMEERINSVKIAIGQALMPAFGGMVVSMGDIVKIVEENKEGIQNFISGGLLLLADAVGHVIFAFGLMQQGFGELRIDFVELEGMLKRTAEGFLFLSRMKSAPLEFAQHWKSLKQGIKDVTAEQEANIETIQKEHNGYGKLAAQLGLANEKFKHGIKRTIEARDATSELEKMLGELNDTAGGGGGGGGTVKVVDTLGIAIRELDDYVQNNIRSTKDWVAAQSEIDEDLLRTYESLGDSTFEIWQQGRDLVKVWDEWGDHLNDGQLKSFISKMEDLADKGGLTTDQMLKLGEAYEAAMKKGLLATEGGIEGVTALETSLAKLPGVILGALQGGGDVFASIGASVGADIGTGLAKRLSETLTNALGESIGGAVGGIMGPLGSMVGSLIGKGIGALAGKLFGGGEIEEVNDLRDAFFDAQGGFEEFAQSMSAVSDEDWAKKIFDAQTVEEFNALVAESQGLMDRTAQAQEALNEAAERYGFTIEEMGPAMQRQRLDEMAGQLYQDFQLLIASGIDVATVIERMGPSMVDFVNTSIAAGQAIPEAMRPMIDELIASGQLLDENGEAFESAEDAGITFAQTMSEMFTELVEKIDDMVNALLGIDDVDVSPTINFPRPPSYPGQGGGGDYPRYAKGDIVTSPHLAIVGDKPEAIIPLDQMNKGGSSDATAMAQMRGLMGDQADMITRAVRDALLQAQG